jgi:hypothetical protein
LTLIQYRSCHLMAANQRVGRLLLLVRRRRRSRRRRSLLL